MKDAATAASFAPGVAYRRRFATRIANPANAKAAEAGSGAADVTGRPPADDNVTPAGATSDVVIVWLRSEFHEALGNCGLVRRICPITLTWNCEGRLDTVTGIVIERSAGKVV